MNESELLSGGQPPPPQTLSSEKAPYNLRRIRPKASEGDSPCGRSPGSKRQLTPPEKSGLKKPCNSGLSPEVRMTPHPPNEEATLNGDPITQGQTMARATPVPEPDKTRQTFNEKFEQLRLVVESIKVRNDNLTDRDSQLTSLIDEASDLCKRMPLNNSRAQQISDLIQNASTLAEQIQVCSLKWPRECYRKTTISHTFDGKDATLILACRKQWDKVESHQLYRQIPALRKIDDGSPEYVEIISTDTINGRSEAAQTTIVIVCEEEASLSTFVERLNDTRLRDKFAKGLSLTAVTTTGLAVDFRKAIEIAMTGTTSICTVVCEERQRPAQMRPAATTRPELITITPGELTYADLLKGVKENLEGQDTGVRVLQAKKTENGQLQLRVQGKATAITSIINSKMPGVETQIKTRLTTMHIRDLEEDVTADEIQKGVHRALPDLPQKTVVIRSIRPAYNNTCNATIQLPPHWAALLDRKRHLQVGLVSSRIRIRTDDYRCARCGQPGHTPKDCTKEDLRGKCYLCRTPGHVMSKCPDKVQLDGNTTRSQNE